VAALVEDGLLQVRPGIGTVVARGRPGGSAARRTLLEDDAERLVVEARKAGVLLQDVLAAVRRHWTRTIRRAG
jgi:GntR family transcriptional regulator